MSEQVYAIRRADGEPMGDYSWMVVDGPNDWDAAECDADADATEPEAIEYELVELTVRPIAKRKLPTNPHTQDDDECEYCGEPWPCDWMREREGTA